MMLLIISYSKESSKASRYEHFEICLLYITCKQIYTKLYKFKTKLGVIISCQK